VRRAIRIEQEPVLKNQKEVAMERLRKSVPAAVAFALLIASATISSSFAQGTAGGATLTVSNTGGSGVNFRATPGGAIIKTFPEGTKMLVVGDNQQADGRSWRNVRSPDGVVGWMAADFLSGTAQAPESTTTQVSTGASNVAGSTLTIVKTGGMNAVIRDNPGGTQIGSYPEGTSMTLVSATPREADNREWKNVRGPDGKSGWMASFLLSGESAGVVASNPTSSGSNPLTSRSPFTLTADMRARALAARARAVPLSATGTNTSNSQNKPTTDTSKQQFSTSSPPSSPTPASKNTSSSSSSKKP
jgi:SH3-like domain-containing protein